MRTHADEADSVDEDAVDGPDSGMRRNRRVADSGKVPIATADGYFVRIEGAAEWLGCKVCFLRRLVAQRRIPYFKIGKYLYFDLYELDAWVRRQRIDPPSW